jgi:hypothetical protein
MVSHIELLKGGAIGRLQKVARNGGEILKIIEWKKSSFLVEMKGGM